MGAETGVSAWARSAQDDELREQLHAVQRDARHAPPAVVQLHSGLGHGASGASSSHQPHSHHLLGHTGRGGYGDDDTSSMYSSGTTVATMLGGGAGQRRQRGRRDPCGWADGEGDLLNGESIKEEEDDNWNEEQEVSRSGQQLPQ